MKEVKLLVKNKKLGGHIVFSEGIYRSNDHEQGRKIVIPQVFHSDPYEKDKKSNVDYQSYREQQQFASAEAEVGLDSDIFKQLILPQNPAFKDVIVDLTVEQNRFLCLPCYFPDAEKKKQQEEEDEGDLSPRKMHSVTTPETPKLLDNCEDIEAFAIIFVFDSYDWRTQSLLARKMHGMKNPPIEENMEQSEDEQHVNIGGANSEATDGMVRTLLKTLTKCIKEEEYNGHFLGYEVAKIMNLQRKHGENMSCNDKDYQDCEVKRRQSVTNNNIEDATFQSKLKSLGDEPTSMTRSTSVQPKAEPTGDLVFRTLRDEIKSSSKLVENLIDIYESFKHRKTRKLTLFNNQEIKLNHEFHQLSDGLLTATYQDAAFTSSDSSSDSETEEEEQIYALQQSKQKKGQIITDYHSRKQTDKMNCMGSQTLLLYQSKKQVLQDLPVEADIIIRRCVQVVSLQKHFNRICYETGMDFRQMSPAINDLVYWGQGILINPVQENSFFLLTKRSASFFLLQRQDKKYLALSQQFNQEYKERFPMDQTNCSTLERALLMFWKPVQLSHFYTVPYQEKYGATSKEIIDFIVIFLLQNKLLQQMNKHYTCKLPQKRAKHRSMLDGCAQAITIEQYLEMKKSKSNKYYQLLVRLYPYMMSLRTSTLHELTQTRTQQSSLTRKYPQEEGPSERDLDAIASKFSDAVEIIYTT